MASSKKNKPDNFKILGAREGGKKCLKKGKKNEMFIFSLNKS